MSRARIIKPGFYKNEQLAECSLLARFIFPGLWMLADRCGRLEDRPKRLKADLLPYDEADVGVLLDELAAQGLIVRYQAGELRLIQIVAFEKHQHCHVREPASTLPPPIKAVPSTVPAPGGHGAGPSDTEADTDTEADGDKPRISEPTAKHRLKAASLGLDCDVEWRKYRDYLKAEGKRHSNETAGFRNWLRKAGEFKARDAPKLSVHDKRAATAAAMTRTSPEMPNELADITAQVVRIA